MTLNEIGQVIDFILSKWCHFYKTEKFNFFHLFYLCPIGNQSVCPEFFGINLNVARV